MTNPSPTRRRGIKHYARYIVAIAILPIILIVTGCGGGGGNSDPSPPLPPPAPTITYSIQVNSTSSGASASLRVFADVSVTWQFSASPASTNSVSYSVSANTSGLRIIDGAGSAAPGTSITTTLRYKCDDVGSIPVSATINVGSANQQVESSVTCHEAVNLEVYQGPLIASVDLLRDESGWDRTVDQISYFEDQILRYAPNRRTFLTFVTVHSENEEVRTQVTFTDAAEGLDLDLVSSSILPPNQSGTRPNYTTREVFELVGGSMGQEIEFELQLSSEDVAGGVTTFSMQELVAHNLPHFNLVVVPIQADHGTFSTDDISAYTDQVEDTLPIGSVSVRTRETFDLTGKEWDFDIDVTPLDHLLELWIAESSRNEFYHGLFSSFENSNLCGIAYVELNVGLTEEISGSCSANTMAHEIGHNLSLAHAPSCGAQDADPDPDFPYTDGSIGTESGWFMKTRRSVGREGLTAVKYFDLMSYCENTFVSQFSYGKAFDFWADRKTTPVVVSSKPRPIAAAFEAVEGKSWVITGRTTTNGEWAINRLKVVNRASHQFTLERTPYRLVVQHIPTGFVLHQEPIQVARIIHGRKDNMAWGTRLPYFELSDLLVSVVDEKGNVLLEQELEYVSSAR